MCERIRQERAVGAVSSESLGPGAESLEDRMRKWKEAVMMCG